MLKRLNEKRDELNKFETAIKSLNEIHNEKINTIRSINNILSVNFSTAIRGLIAVIIYFINIKHFGWVLFSFSLFNS